MHSAEVKADFEEYVAARMPALLRTAYLLTGNQSDAEDLVQTALMHAVPTWHALTTSPDAYVKRAMVNANISRWRRVRGREVLHADPDTGLVVQATDVAASVDVVRALQQWSPRQRAVVVLRYYEDYSEQQIADTLRISAGTVKSTAHDALKRLQGLLGDLVPVG